jgi:hypothetical protein
MRRFSSRLSSGTPLMWSRISARRRPPQISPWPHSSHSAILMPSASRRRLRWPRWYVDCSTSSSDSGVGGRARDSRRIASGSKCAVLMLHRAAYFLMVRWLPPAGRRWTLRSASLNDRELAIASRRALSVKLTRLGTNVCSHARRTGSLGATVEHRARDAELGSQGSNLILSIQSAPCCQLHHSPTGRTEGVERPVNGTSDTTMPACLNPPS